MLVSLIKVSLNDRQNKLTSQNINSLKKKQISAVENIVHSSCHLNFLAYHLINNLYQYNVRT